MNAKVPAKNTKKRSKSNAKAPTAPTSQLKKANFPKEVKKLYDLGTAFWASGALIAAVKLNLFTHLDNGPLTLEATARRLGTNKRWTDKLLVACSALGLIEKRDNQFSNTAAAADLLVEGKPYYQGEFLTYLGTTWDRFGNLDHTLQTGQRNDAEDDGAKRGDEKINRAWIMSSHNIAMSGQAEALARVLDLKGRKRLCDVCSGPGTYAAVLCLQNPELHATVLDEQEIIPVAQELISRFNLQDRITVKPAQLLYGSYGEEHDVVLLSGVLHGFSEANCKKILRKAFNSLESGGMIVIQEMLLDHDEAKPLFPALFSLNMTMGASYSAEEIMKWLLDTGFIKVQVKDIPGGHWMDHIITAYK